MAGIFPPDTMGGVPPGPGVVNGYIPGNTVVGGGPFYAASDCSTMLTDGQMNALVSENLAAVDRLGFAFNANLVTNLGDALVVRFDQKLDTDGGAMTGPLILNADPVDPLGAATKQYVDGSYAGHVLKAGDVMTGPLQLPGNPAGALEAIPKQYADQIAGTLSGQITQLGNDKVNRAGDTMGGPLVLPADPTQPLQAATKSYADTKLGDAPNDGKTYGRLNAGWVEVGGAGGSFLPLVGGTLTGNLTISKLTAKVQLDSTGNNDPTAVAYRRQGVDRWLAQMTGDTEAGANLGSDYALLRCADNGAPIDTPFKVERQTGRTIVVGELINASAPTLEFGKDAGSAATIQTRNRNTGYLRWGLALGDATTGDGGSVLGSDFKLDRYSDGGAVLGTSLRITRGSGFWTVGSGQITLGDPAGSAVFALNAATGASNVAQLQFKRNGVNRWIAQAVAAGDDFMLYRYNDSGTGLGSPFSISRANGSISLGAIAGQYWGPGGAVGQCTLGASYGGISHYYRAIQTVGDAGLYAAYFANYYQTGVGVIGFSDSYTVYATSSDVRLKTDIQEFTDGRKIIDRLPIKRFNWTVNGTRGIGVLAQEVADVQPDAVVRGRGEPGDQDFMPWMTDYSKFVPALIQAVQEAHRQIDELKAQVAQLQGARS